MSNDSSLKLIAELASWNGRLSAAVAIALNDLQHNNQRGALKILAAIDAEYEAYRDEQIAKAREWRPAPMTVREKDLDYDLKHGE